VKSSGADSVRLALEGKKYHTESYENPDDAYADAAEQITQRMKGSGATARGRGC
jgi:hypothetical protein